MNELDSDNPRNDSLTIAFGYNASFLKTHQYSKKIAHLLTLANTVISRMSINRNSTAISNLNPKMVESRTHIMTRNRQGSFGCASIPTWNIFGRRFPQLEALLTQLYERAKSCWENEKKHHKNKIADLFWVMCSYNPFSTGSPYNNFIPIPISIPSFFSLSSQLYGREINHVHG